MSKDSGLQQPVLAAVKALMADGTYKKILDYWGVAGRRDQQPDDQRSDRLAGREAGGVRDRQRSRSDADRDRLTRLRRFRSAISGRWIAAAIVVIIAAALIRSAVDQRPASSGTSSATTCSTPGSSKGLVKTLELTVLGMVIGIVLGVVLAADAALGEPAAQRRQLGLHLVLPGHPAAGPDPVLVFNIAALYPTIDLGIPFGPSFIHLNANDLITPFVAGMLALGLNEGAYMAEIVRAGIISVDEGQTEAAKALGMTRGADHARIVLPQAMRVIIPPTGNETISMLKNSSLVSVIAVTGAALQRAR